MPRSGGEAAGSPVRLVFLTSLSQEAAPSIAAERVSSPNIRPELALRCAKPSLQQWPERSAPLG